MSIGLKLFGLLWILLLSPATVSGQPKLWGMTFGGGEYNTGAIYSVDHNGESYTLRKSFIVKNPGYLPSYTQPIEFSSGRMFGVMGSGLVFEYDINTKQYQKRADFAVGAWPVGKLTKVGDKLFGMTSTGGVNNKGSIYEFDPATDQITVKFSFSTPIGEGPLGGLTLHANGKLYGVTNRGGTEGGGTLFSFDPAIDAFTKLWDFGLSVGSNPHGTLLAASDGMLYGTTYEGSPFGGGAIFRFDPVTGNYVGLHAFRDSPSPDPNGANPFGDLLEASDGKFYGMTTTGGSANSGVLYRFGSGIGFQKLADLTGASHGYDDCGLVEYSNGVLYAAARGGIHDGGVIFEYNFLTGSFSNKFDFDIANGKGPSGSLVKFSNGKLYGLTTYGGNGGYGVLYEYDPALSNFSKLVDFNERPMGSNPHGSLMLASNGKFYGMTRSGGIRDQGVLFEFDSATYELQVLANFSPVLSGLDPQSHLVQLPNGKLYGVTSFGGLHNAGVLFEFDPVTGSFMKKHDFGPLLGPSDGVHPKGGLLLSSSGKLLGVTGDGGTQNAGTLFVYDPEQGVFTSVQSFELDVTGSYPDSRLVQTWDSRIYGITSYGGTGLGGVLFEFEESSNTISARYNFPQFTHPGDGVTLGPNGKLYGVTAYNGPDNRGTLYEFDQQSSTLTTKVTFDGPVRGGFPLASLTLARNGKFYGTTDEGGLNNFGTLFEFDPTSSVFTKKFDMEQATGKNPGWTKLVGHGTDVLTSTRSAETFAAYPNPAKDYLEIKGIGSDVSNIQLFDISGKRIEVKTENGKEQFVLDVRDLRPGLYLVLYITDLGRYTYKFVKN